jgi:predicted nucleic acid-binding Zn ribbon protein
MDWLTFCFGGAGFTGILPLGPWNALLLPAGRLTGEEWTEQDADVVRLVYEVLVEQTPCARCGAPLRRSVSAHIVAAFTGPRFMVTARCRSWRRHRHVAVVRHGRGGLQFEALHPA